LREIQKHIVKPWGADFGYLIITQCPHTKIQIK
jgi:hypothetical protein